MHPLVYSRHTLVADPDLTSLMIAYALFLALRLPSIHLLSHLQALLTYACIDDRYREGQEGLIQPRILGRPW